MNVLEAFVHDPLVEWESEYNKKVNDRLFYRKRGLLELTMCDLGTRCFPDQGQTLPNDY